MTQDLKEQLSQLPSKPGVYQYFNRSEELLYVGKAKNIAKRVNSYWHKQHQSPWTQLLVEEITTIKIIEVKTELEALMLENSLIKSLRPKYNIQLRDDKTFPFLRVSKDRLPLFSIVRQVKQDKARYFGPFLSATYLRAMLKLLQQLYGIRTTHERSYESRSTVPNQIGLGARHLDNQTMYNQNVEQAIKFLSSPQPEMERLVRQQMTDAAENQEFERAAVLRDRLNAIEQLRQSQSLFSPTHGPRDYIGLAQSGGLISVYILHELDGKIINHKQFFFTVRENLKTVEIMTEIITFLYVNGLAIPEVLVLPFPPQEETELVTLLKQMRGKKVKLITPKRGELRAKLMTASDNAHYQLKLEALKKHRRQSGLTDLAKVLSLSLIPKRIEAFDISNLGANHIVGASIVFIDGQPVKSEYRKYKIETPQGQDDFASMRELVYRRMNNHDRPAPDLLLIDGGKGQLSAAIDALHLAKINVPLVALAKKEELLFSPEKIEPIILPANSDALLLLTAIRDEVHRFVITFHRQRRRKSLLN